LVLLQGRLGVAGAAWRRRVGRGCAGGRRGGVAGGGGRKQRCRGRLRAERRARGPRQAGRWWAVPPNNDSLSWRAVILHVSPALWTRPQHACSSRNPVTSTGRHVFSTKYCLQDHLCARTTSCVASACTSELVRQSRFKSTRSLRRRAAACVAASLAEPAGAWRPPHCAVPPAAHAGALVHQVSLSKRRIS
jgi:hypothetical protein